MKPFSRALALLLVIAMIFSLAACTGGGGTPGGATAAPTPTAGQSAAPAPTEEPASPESAALAELDREIFADYVSSDALTYHLSVAHPENFPEITDVETGWGEFTYAEAERATEAEKAWLERLRAINREALSADEQLTFDTLEQYLEWNIAGFDYYYYNEVLDTLVGFHSNLPLNMVFYDMHTKADVENYLVLLEDTPRFIGLVLQYEQEKSAAGLFMRDAALDQILDQLQTFIDARESCFLFGTFDEFIAGIEELSAGERTAYSARNEELVNALIDSYQSLYDGLEALRGTATNDGGLANYGEEGRAFFEAELKYSACSDITVEEALAVLQDELIAQMTRMSDAAASDPTVWDNFDKFDLSIGTTEENLDYLEGLMERYYPALPEHNVTFMDCPSELEDQFSPAAYLIPPVDDPSENLIILNAKTLADDTRYLDTLAHEGYPGHMYHYQYLRTLVDKTGYTRQSIGLSGYYEAWSQSGECFFDGYNTRFGADYCNFMSANTFVGNLILPSIVSIMVNYNSSGVEEIQKMLTLYYSEESAAELAEVYYQYAVENPFYFLEYALGFSMYQQKLREARKACGYMFDLMSYNKAFLDIGPTYFNLIMPTLDEWIAANKKA